MSTIAIRFKSVFVPSTRRTPQPTTSSIHSSFPTSESIAPTSAHSSSEAQHPGQKSPSTIHFSIDQSDTTHTHRPRANTATHASQRSRSRTFSGSSTPGSPPRSPTTGSAYQQPPSAPSYVKMPVIPGYCF